MRRKTRRKTRRDSLLARATATASNTSFLTVRRIAAWDLEIVHESAFETQFCRKDHEKDFAQDL